ncbi:hypothetical protein PGT21_020415 [Puccinia graminis f. sp. tritici]|uniref:Uncharacterized protein n=1 Tax=Puccinia graminis f. sp. tritici TaxID=56615 RepID=A0A5B0Q3K8_PUCGR|nr:hypothetical protein PGT21_020415 [Puccinia graminis f. sp. tritici]
MEPVSAPVHIGSMAKLQAFVIATSKTELCRRNCGERLVGIGHHPDNQRDQTTQAT